MENKEFEKKTETRGHLASKRDQVARSRKAGRATQVRLGHHRPTPMTDGDINR
jgi:hypothetical protein